MPRDLTRFVRAPLAGIIGEARRSTIQEQRVTGAAPIPSLPPPEPANPQVLGLDGQPKEVHDFMLGVDALGDPSSRLRVNGTTRSYYRN